MSPHFGSSSAPGLATDWIRDHPGRTRCPPRLVPRPSSPRITAVGRQPPAPRDETFGPRGARSVHRGGGAEGDAMSEENGLYAATRGDELFGKGDLDSSKNEIWRTDEIWRTEGVGPSTSEYMGIDALIGYFSQLFELSGSAFHRARPRLEAHGSSGRIPGIVERLRRRDRGARVDPPTEGACSQRCGCPRAVRLHGGLPCGRADRRQLRSRTLAFGSVTDLGSPGRSGALLHRFAKRSSAWRSSVPSANSAFGRPLAASQEPGQCHGKTVQAPAGRPLAH